MSSPISAADVKPALGGAATPLGMLGRMPRELRHHVYQYLLNTQFNRIDPAPVPKNRTKEVPNETGGHETGNEAPSGPFILPQWYRFHTAILGVNKTINNEAAAYMCKSNGFVLLQYSMPQFRAWLSLAHVPVVSNMLRSKLVASSSGSPPGINTALDGTVDFDCWCMKITFMWPTHWKSLWPTESAWDLCDDGVTVIALQDLHILCNFLAALCTGASPNCVLIDHPRRPTGTILTRQRKFEPTIIPDDTRPFEFGGVPEMTLEVREEPSELRKQRDPSAAWYKCLSTLEQVRVLEEIKTIIGIGYQLTTLGFTSTNRALEKAVKKHTAPRILSVAATDHTRMQCTLAQMKISENQYMMGILGFPCECATYTRCLLSSSLSKHPGGTDIPGLEADRDRARLLDQKRVLKVDMTMKSAWVCLARESYMDFAQRVYYGLGADDWKYIKQPTPALRLDYYHMVAIRYMVDLIMYEEPGYLEHLTPAIEDVKSVNIDHNDYLKADLPLIEQFHAEIEGVSSNIERHKMRSLTVVLRVLIRR